MSRTRDVNQCRLSSSGQRQAVHRARFEHCHARECANVAGARSEQALDRAVEFGAGAALPIWCGQLTEEQPVEQRHDVAGHDVGFAHRRRRDDRIGESELIENTGERLGQWFTVPGAQFGGVDLGQAGDRGLQCHR